MPVLKYRWKQEEREGILILRYDVDHSSRSKVKVQLDGDIPHVMKFKGQVPSREASKGALEILWAAGIRKQLGLEYGD